MNKNSSDGFEQSEHKTDGQLIQVTSYVILLFTAIIFITGNYVEMGSWQFYTTILLLSLVLIINIFWHLFEDKLKNYEFSNIAFIVLCVLITLSIAWVGKFYNIVFMIFMITAQAFMVLKFKIASYITGVFVCFYLAIMWMIGLNLEGIINLAVALVVGLVFVITLSIVLRRYAEQTTRAESLANQLQLVNLELVEARQKEKELAVVEERVRLARDIHDGLGHHLTALNIQLQAAQKMLEIQPEKALEAIQICRQEAKSALEEVRQSVAVMRRSPMDGKSLNEAIHDLIRNFEVTTLKKVSLELSDSLISFGPQVSDTIYRSIQEGLTNIQKHATEASKISVRLYIQDGMITLEIEDDDIRPVERDLSSGFGLSGLRERAELLGGVLILDTKKSSGFLVRIEIPLEGGLHD